MSLAQDLLFQHRGFFPKEFNGSLELRKIFLFFKKRLLSCIGMNGPLVWVLGYSKQMCLNPSIPEFSGGGLSGRDEAGVHVF